MTMQLQRFTGCKSLISFKPHPATTTRNGLSLAIMMFWRIAANCYPVGMKENWADWQVETRYRLSEMVIDEHFNNVDGGFTRLRL